VGGRSQVPTGDNLFYTFDGTSRPFLFPPPSTKPGYAPADTPIRLLLNLITELDEAVQTKSHEIVSVQNRVVLINI